MFGRKQKVKFKPSKARLVYGTAFLLGLSGALVMYTASTFFSEAWKTDNVGFVYIALHVLNLIGLFSLSRVIGAFGKTATLFFLFLGAIVSLVFLIVLGVSPVGSVFLVFFLAHLVLLWATLDSILESFSTNSESGRIRGLYLMSMNGGLLLGPLLSTALIELYGYSGLYTTTLVFFSLLFIVSLLALYGVDQRPKTKISLAKTFEAVKKRSDIAYIYSISFTLFFFYAILILFTPIYLLKLGMPWQEIGLLLSLVLIPFILIQYPAGRLADKRLGEKEMIIVALTIMALALSFMPNISTSSFLLWLVVLLVGRVGAALLEVLGDSYFYKRIDGEDVSLINFFRTARPLAYISAALLSTIMLFFLPLSSVFWLPFAVAVMALYPALRLQDNEASG